MTIDAAAIAVAKGVTHVLLYASALVLIGVATCRAAVFPRAGAALAGADRHAARLGIAAAAALLVAVVLRLYVQVIDSYLTPRPTPEMLRLLLFHTRTWGRGTLGQLAIATTLVVVTRAAAGDGAWRRRGSAAAGLAAALAVPLTGHAAAHGGPAGVGAQALHVLALGAWLGALAVVLRTTAALPVEALAGALAAFSPVARAAAVTVAAAGVAALLSHVGTDGLVGSPYGAVLAGKLALFGGVAALGYVNWRHRTPRLREAAGRASLLRTARAEVALGALALVLTAVLTAIGRPGD